MSLEVGKLDTGSEVVWRQCFVVPTPDQDREGQKLLAFLRNQMGCKGVTAVTVARRYHVETTADQFEDAKTSVLSSVPLQDVMDETEFYARFPQCKELPTGPAPNQISTRNANIGLAFQMRFGGMPPKVQSAEVIMVEGITDEEYQQFGSFYVNPVERVVVPRGDPKKPEAMAIPTLVEVLDGFRDCKTSEQLLAWKEKHGVRLSMENLLRVQEEFKEVEHRDPTRAEIKVFEARWSDHCCHLTFNQKLTEISIGGTVVYVDGNLVEGVSLSSAYERELLRAVQEFVLDRHRVLGEKARTTPLSLMDLAIFTRKEAELEGRLTAVELSTRENNSAVLPVGKNLVGFKVETHNHPTTIGPRGGAETEIGGAWRDLGAMRIVPIGGIRVSGRGDPRRNLNDRLGDQLHPRYLTQEAAGGNSAYADAAGFPTNGIYEFFFDDREGGVTFDAKTFECGFVIGAAPMENIVSREPKPGDKIMLYGGNTGRDGIGGASGSSAELTRGSVKKSKGEVQMGDPIEEQAFLEMIFDQSVMHLIVAQNDYGAGGIATSNGELFSGVRVNLDPVPLRTPDMRPDEILISESQERMAPVVPAEKEQEFIEGARRHNVPAVCVGEITDTGRFQVMWKGQVVCNLRTEFLNSGWVRGEKKADIQSHGDPRSYFEAYPAEVPPDGSLRDQWNANIGSLAHAGQRGLGGMFDGTVRGRSVATGYSGKHQASPLNAIVLHTDEHGEDGLGVAAAHGWDPKLMNDYPYVGAAYDVFAAVMRVVASGADKETVRLALQNYFEGPGEVPERWGNMLQAQLGARMAQKITKAIATNGKDSSAGAAEIDGTRYRVPHTIAAFAIAPMEVDRLVQSCFQEAGNHLVHLDFKREESGMPDPKSFKALMNQLDRLITQGKVKSCSVVQSGGLARTLTEMSFGNRIGADLNDIAGNNPQRWFAPLLASVVVEIPGGEDIRTMLSGLGSEYTILGKTTNSEKISVNGGNGFSADIEALQKTWDGTLAETFPVEPLSQEQGSVRVEPAPGGRYVKPALRKSILHPKAVVPRFPGTNSHRETGWFLEQAGARVETPVFCNRTPEQVEESLRELADSIRNAQQIILSGGFSFRDEAETGLGMAVALRNERVADAIMRAREQNGLIILGICNGFQVLAALGAFPYGDIRTLQEDDPVLTANTLGRFHTQKVDMRVRKNKSPFLQHFDEGEDVSAILAAGQANVFMRTQKKLDELWASGSVALQYVGTDGRTGMDFAHNPPGSMDAIAGLTSKDGAVTGLMPHLERFGEGQSLNVPGKRGAAKFFQGGVDHFR